MNTLDVDGTPIAYWTWGEGDDGPPLVLVHGGGAHTGWWEPVIPHLVPGRRIVALDLSGHGDSGRRDSYPMAAWADEVAAVIEHALGTPAVVVGHSMGGRVAPTTAFRHPALVEALVIVDSAMPLPPSFKAPSDRPAKVYATREEILGRFRLMPEQPAGDLTAVAERGIRRTEGGWTWKFDPRVFTRLHEPAPEDTLPKLSCPVALIQGEHSAVTKPEYAADLVRRLGRPAPLVMMPGVHHHLMLEEPETLAAILDWLPETRLRTSAAAPATPR